MFKDKTIVYTSGTFDMFHYNHLRMINYARSLADILIVGVSTDELVSSYKAKPIIPFTERLQIIEALKTPDRKSTRLNSRYCHSTTYVGSFRNSQKAEYRRFCRGRRLVWQVWLFERLGRSGILFPLRDRSVLFQLEENDPWFIWSEFEVSTAIQTWIC